MWKKYKEVRVVVVGETRLDWLQRKTLTDGLLFSQSDFFSLRMRKPVEKTGKTYCNLCRFWQKMYWHCLCKTRALMKKESCESFFFFFFESEKADGLVRDRGSEWKLFIVQIGDGPQNDKVSTAADWILQTKGGYGGGGGGGNWLKSVVGRVLLGSRYGF